MTAQSFNCTDLILDT